MSVLIDSSVTIYEVIQNIKDGKYVMPAFQRQYVWSMEQIEKLWDSILLDYPIATFLFWHVDDDNVTWDTYFCNFLSSVTFDSRKQADSVNYELSSIDVKLTDTAVLDGQQRLTSLYLLLNCLGLNVKNTLTLIAQRVKELRQSVSRQQFGGNL